MVNQLWYIATSKVTCDSPCCVIFYGEEKNARKRFFELCVEGYNKRNIRQCSSVREIIEADMAAEGWENDGLDEDEGEYLQEVLGRMDAWSDPLDSDADLREGYMLLHKALRNKLVRITHVVAQR